MNVRLVTSGATHDDLSDSDYRDIYDELRQNMSLDKLCALLDSAYSKAQWNKYEHGAISLVRIMRQELRRAVGLPELPPTVVEAVSVVDPDATVWRIGDEQPDRIVLVGRATKGAFRVDDGITSINETEAPEMAVPLVTQAVRKPLVRPVATPAQNERRLATGATWTQIIEAGLAAMEAK